MSWHRHFTKLLGLLLLLAGHACTDSGNPLEDVPWPPPPDDLGLDRGVPRERWVEPDIAVGPPVPVTVATWNVHNFFDTVDDPKHRDEVLAAAEVTAKVKAIGAGLRALGADVVALQEVENIGLLTRLNNEELGSLGYKEARLSPGNDMRGINVALLSRFRVIKFMSHAGDRFQGVDGDTTTYGFSRDCLEVVLEAGPGRFLTLLINHLAATESPDAVPRRHAQAAQVRRIADDTLKHRPEANLAVVGDLNDTPGSKTLQLIETGTSPLFDLLTLVPAGERFTFYYGSQKEQIDYILVSPGLKADLQAGSVRADHASVFKDASDHYPVVARFTLE